MDQVPLIYTCNYTTGRFLKKKKKNTPTVDLGPFCVPMRENGGRKDQAVIVHFTIALNRWNFMQAPYFFNGKLDEDNRFSQFSKFDPFVGK